MKNLNKKMMENLEKYLVEFLELNGYDENAEAEGICTIDVEKYTKYFYNCIDRINSIKELNVWVNGGMIANFEYNTYNIIPEVSVIDTEINSYKYISPKEFVKNTNKYILLV